MGLTATLNLCLICIKITWALAIELDHIHKKLEINRTKIKGDCQSGRKVVTHNSKSDLPLAQLSSSGVVVVWGFMCYTFGIDLSFVHLQLLCNWGQKSYAIAWFVAISLHIPAWNPKSVPTLFYCIQLSPLSFWFVVWAALLRAQD